MRKSIADKELSDTQALQENDSITESVGAAND
ncbi:transcriptional regulator, partial [Escherichia coli]